MLAFGGGIINLPEFVGGHAWLEHWLEPVTAASQVDPPADRCARRRASPMAPSWALVGLAVSSRWLGWWPGGGRRGRLPSCGPSDAPADTGFWKVLFHKYYVDEIYDAIIVQPLIAFSDRFLWRTVDEKLVDGAGVNGTAGATRAAGWLGGRLQSGQVGLYSRSSWWAPST